MSWFNSIEAVSKLGMLIAGLIVVLGSFGFVLRFQEAKLKAASDREKTALRLQLDTELKLKAESALSVAEKLKADAMPRVLTSEQRKLLTAVATLHPEQRFEVVEYGLSKEATNFANDIAGALVSGGWKCKTNGIMTGVEQRKGVLVFIPKKDTTNGAAAALTAALREGGIETSYSWDDGFLPVTLEQGVMGLFVGPK